MTISHFDHIWANRLRFEPIGPCPRNCGGGVREMSYFKVCPICGSHLDPGDSCADCREKENAAQGAANAPDGKVEHVDHDVSASHNNRK